MRHKVVKFIKEWRMEWAIVTLFCYVVAIPATIIVFPANSLWLAVLILFTGVTTTLNQIADLLISADTHDEVRDCPDDETGIASADDS